MNNKQGRRVTVKLKKPNPLFEKWLTEWRDNAKEKDSKMQYCFSTALQSLRKYPLPLNTGKDCKILQGFGDKLCNMLDHKLRKHNLESEKLTPVSDVSGSPKIHSTESTSTKTKRAEVEKVRTEDLVAEVNYITELYTTDTGNERVANDEVTTNKTTFKIDAHQIGYRSAEYAILITVYETYLKNDDKISMTKSEIIKSAQDLCDKSFIKADIETCKTAWAEMSTLIKEKLIVKEGKPPKFSLTEKGLSVASELQKMSFYSIENTTNSDFRINGLCTSEKQTENCGPGITSNAKVNSTSSSNHVQTKGESLILQPYSCDIILIVDVQETNGNTKKSSDSDDITFHLSRLKVPYEVRHLKVGDYLWVARGRRNTVELVLPYVIERKRIDDFGSSIKDGRYKEQKFRLQQSGVQNIVYLIESFEDIQSSVPAQALRQATINTLVQCGMQIKFTESLRATAHYLSCMSQVLYKQYNAKILIACPKSNLVKVDMDDDCVSLMTFEEFNHTNVKQKNFSASDMFIRQLLQLKGLSLDKASAIIDKYPTPKLLSLAYKELDDKEQGELLLANIRIGNSNKKIGPVISKVLYEFYTMDEFK